jgi:PAS domain S-box-containing protein
MTSPAINLSLPLTPQLSHPVAQRVLKASRQPVVVLDEHLRIVFANESFCSWMHVRWPELEDKAVEQYLRSPEIITRLLSVGGESATQEVPIECPVPRGGNQRLKLMVDVFQVLEQELRAVVIDGTDEQEAGSAMDLNPVVPFFGKIWHNKENDLLRSVMESSGDGIGVLDSGGHCVIWNPACERILGMTPGAIRLDQWPQYFGLYLPDKKTLFPAEDLPLAKALRGESVDHMEIFVRNKIHSEGVWISITARPLTAGSEGAVATFRDISFRKDTEEALAQQAAEVERSNRELEQFAYVASHDLQEPLRMVSSYVQLLSRRYQGKLDSDADEFIAYASEGAKRMSDLINDLLGYSRIGRGTAAQGPVECEAVLARVLQILGARIEDSGAVITHDLLPVIEANESQLIQLLQNLIDNAIKFRSEEAPRIHVSAKAQDGKWIFSVSDNGIGIAPEYKERVFVIFQRLHNRQAYPGTGIGLAVCKKIVEQQGGAIWLEPRAGGGSTVLFNWPAGTGTNRKKVGAHA